MTMSEKRITMRRKFWSQHARATDQTKHSSRRAPARPDAWEERTCNPATIDDASASPLCMANMSAPQGEASASSPAATVAPPPAAPGGSRESARRRRWSTIALAVALAVGIAAVWIDARNRDRQLRTEVAQRLAEGDAGDKALRASL